MPRRGEIKALRFRVEQPDPTRRQLEKTRDDFERALERRARVRSIGERRRDRFEDEGVAARFRQLSAGSGAGSKRGTAVPSRKCGNSETENCIPV